MSLNFCYQFVCQGASKEYILKDGSFYHICEVWSIKCLQEKQEYSTLSHVFVEQMLQSAILQIEI